MSLGAQDSIISPRETVIQKEGGGRHENKQRENRYIGKKARDSNRATETHMIWTSVLSFLTSLVSHVSPHWKTSLEEQSSPAVQQPGNWKWIADCNTLADSSDSHTVLLCEYFIKDKVQFQVSICVRLEFALLFPHHLNQTGATEKNE